MNEQAPMMRDPVQIPRELLARLMAAIETPDDLTTEEVSHLLEDADAFYPHEIETVSPETLSAALRRPRPDYDPRIDHPERYTDGPI